jgi:hypothetical protein
MSDLELTMMRRVGELNKENARLKAEVERLRRVSINNIVVGYETAKAEVDKWKSWAEAEHAEKKVLKAEVERLDTLCRELSRQHSDISCENIMLRKAGDELHAFLMNYIVESRISSAYLYKLDDGWLAAKEGNPRD